MPWVLSVNFRDAKGARSSTQFNIDQGADSLAANATAASMVSKIAPLIGGGIESAHLLVPVTGATYTNLPTATSDVEEGARFIMRTVGGYSTQARIPTFLESKMVSGSNIVNVADPDVAAFLLLWTVGLPANSTFVDSRNDAVESLASAREAFQRSRRNI